jgi:hypothetical protein
MGIVGEWTEDLPARQPSTRLKGFRLLFGAGQVTSKYTVNNFDLCSFAVSFKDSVGSPCSYGGMSGGGLWRVYIDTDKKVTRERRLVGVAFYEYDTDTGQRMITCHGPKSVYTHLFNAVCEAWPTEIGHLASQP